MKEILPQMEEVSEYTGTAKGALPYFFLSFSFFFTLALFVAALLVTDEKYCGELWIPALLLVVFCAVGRVLRCRIRLSMETNRIFPCPLAVSKRLRSL